jgi:hypothetical protein
VQNDDDWGAWYFGNKTKTALWIYYEDNNWYETSDTLSQTQKNQINTALEKIKKRLKAEELGGGKRMTTRLSSLKKQIAVALPKITDVELKAKLTYLQDSL